MSADEDQPALVATFANGWEAEYSQGCLTDAGIPSWVERVGLDNPYRLASGGMGVVRLFVPSGRVVEARRLLDELTPAPDEPEATQSIGGVPLWIRVVGAILLLSIVVSAVPHGLRVPAAVVALAGFIFWRWLRAGPTVDSYDDASDERRAPP